MVVAHANSLRGLVKHIDNLSASQIQKIGIPNGIPLVYKFDRLMYPIPAENCVEPLNGEFLEKKGLLRAALGREKALAQSVPGYDDLTQTGEKTAKELTSSTFTPSTYNMHVKEETQYFNRVRSLQLLEDDLPLYSDIDDCPTDCLPPDTNNAPPRPP